MSTSSRKTRKGKAKNKCKGKTERIKRIRDILVRFFSGDNAVYVPRIKDPFKTLIATVISARTKDEVTEIASKRLFKKYPTPEKLAKANPKEVAKLIYPAGFYKTKAPRLVEIARIITNEYNGKVPNTLDALMALPGVGRKTANIVLVYGFGIPAIPVDTHVHRISNRIGLVKTKTPHETEKELEKIVPKRIWFDINWTFVRLGQTICKPIGPKCEICPIVKLCDYGRERLRS